MRDVSISWQVVKRYIRVTTRHPSVVIKINSNMLSENHKRLQTSTSCCPLSTTPLSKHCRCTCELPDPEQPSKLRRMIYGTSQTLGVEVLLLTAVLPPSAEPPHRLYCPPPPTVPCVYSSSFGFIGRKLYAPTAALDSELHVPNERVKLR